MVGFWTSVAIGKNFWAFLFAVVTATLCAPGISLGETTNELSFSPCTAYVNFLNGADNNNSPDCNTVENLIIGDSDLPTAGFFFKYKDSVKRKNIFGMLSQTAINLYVGTDLDTLVSMQKIDKFLYARLEVRGDFDRSVFYGSILTAIEISYIKKICGSQCSEISSAVTFRETLGMDITLTNDDDPRLVFLCAIKFDNFNIPLKKVTSSARFVECTKNFK